MVSICLLWLVNIFCLRIDDINILIDTEVAYFLCITKEKDWFNAKSPAFIEQNDRRPLSRIRVDFKHCSSLKKGRAWFYVLLEGTQM